MIKITLKSTNYLKNTFIIFFGGIIFGFIGIALMIVYNQNALKMKLFSNCSKNETINCHKRQERNIPFKVIGVLKTQNNIILHGDKVEMTLIYSDIKPEDFYKNFELNTFIKSNGKIPTADFSKIIIGIVLYYTPNNVLGVDVKRVYEFIKYPECFDCYDKCNKILVGIDISVETGVDENLFPTTVILIQIDPPKEWNRKNISIHPNIYKSNKLWNDFLKGVYN